jgi:hypothetical protein
MLLRLRLQHGRPMLVSIPKPGVVRFGAATKPISPSGRESFT